MVRCWKYEIAILWLKWKWDWSTVQVKEARGPMTPYTPLNITNVHNIDLIPATPLNIFRLLLISMNSFYPC